jgi:hypothetical protein
MKTAPDRKTVQGLLTFTLRKVNVQLRRLRLRQ